MADHTAYYYEPCAGHGLKHDPFNSIVAPRPIGWISTISSDDVANLAPYSFFNAFNYHPPIIGFSSIGWKDSVANIESTREFCWNLASKPLAAAMNLSCAPATADVDEFELAGLTKAPSRLVRVPRVMESSVNFECRLSQLVQLRAADGVPIDSWLVIGEVVAVHIDRRLLAKGIFDTIAAQPILRGGGPGDYFTIAPDALFQMQRPQWPCNNNVSSEAGEHE
jgi:flavin reductase (DIM6/NTAB) family NADH-FMN oxidoreductase RutF